MKTVTTAEIPPKLPVAELMVVVGLPLVAIMASISLAVVAYLHGFAELAAH